MESYSLHELNEYIKRVIALNFTETIWIHAEIAQIKETRGQVYLELIEKAEEDEQILAQSQAVIWYKSYLFIKNKLGELAHSILQEGIVVKAKVTVNFHERYGLKLVIEDIDPSYTLGVLELQRKEIIDRLQKEGYFDKNKQTEFPIVAQRMAVISSAQAAGLKDFYAQLENNPYGYFFKIELFNASVQGQNLEKEIVKAIESIQLRAEDFDLIAIIRGGGSKIDLAGFDSFLLGKAIADCSLPVVTGIGHEIDQNIADLVAKLSLKTPTAVANWIIDHNLDFESQLVYYWQEIQKSALSDIKEQKNLLSMLEQSVQILPSSILSDNLGKLEYLQKILHFGFTKRIEDMNAFLVQTNHLAQISLPENTIKRGFALIKKNQRIVISIDQVESSDSLNIIMKDGAMDVKVNDIKK